MCSLVTSIFVYACESWTLTAELQRRIQAMEMRCYRKILQISYKDHVTNKEVHAKIQQAIGCFLFIRSGQNHLARHSERGKKTRQTEEEVGRQQGLDRPGVRQVPEGSGEQGKMEKTGCKICGAPINLAVKGLMMIMMIVSFVRKRVGGLGVVVGGGVLGGGVLRPSPHKLWCINKQTVHEDHANLTKGCIVLSQAQCNENQLT